MAASGNFVLNKTMSCNDKNPIWMNEKIKSKIKSKFKLKSKKISKNKLCKTCITNDRNENNFSNLEKSITEFKELASTFKASYYEHLGKKLNDPTI